MDHPDLHTAKRPILTFSFSQLGMRYVDYKIQMRMLLALVVMELGIISVGLFYLYHRFSTLIDANLYRIHRQASSDMFTLLLYETGWVIGVSLLVNLAALFIADRLWVNYVHSILMAFGLHADQIADLDFRDQHSNHAPKHESLDMIQMWQQGERQRALAIRAAIHAIDPDAVDDPHGREQIVKQLTTIQSLLPPYSSRFVGRTHSMSDHS
ncbi:MAG: hypothetical protein HQL84_16625 [Magnetococcales bacterium]|nr:hypothetical protein [Magnetococcales bacterium]MBF0151646.1 hypothetical protein [Magnetococcales bacterium]MBF0174796.1 hypothetical protein [Magnetococcales bacterium]MBF0346059.1 hypothetical protein [Magnetococcales bacterium]MBF0632637.1 hypothetical protein [Magnetococcales bacterium]